jgi:hypothetical protein
MPTCVRQRSVVIGELPHSALQGERPPYGAATISKKCSALTLYTGRLPLPSNKGCSGGMFTASVTVDVPMGRHRSALAFCIVDIHNGDREKIRKYQTQKCGCACVYNGTYLPNHHPIPPLQLPISTPLTNDSTDPSTLPPPSRRLPRNRLITTTSVIDALTRASESLVTVSAVSISTLAVFV